MDNQPTPVKGEQPLSIVLPYLQDRLGWPFAKGWHVLQELAENGKIQIIYRSKYQGDHDAILTPDRDLSDLTIFNGIFVDDIAVVQEAYFPQMQTQGVAAPVVPDEATSNESSRNPIRPKRNGGRHADLRNAAIQAINEIYPSGIPENEKDDVVLFNVNTYIKNNNGKEIKMRTLRRAMGRK